MQRAVVYNAAFGQLIEAASVAARTDDRRNSKATMGGPHLHIVQMWAPPVNLARDSSVRREKN
jgi:hypothetical protein